MTTQREGQLAALDIVLRATNKARHTRRDAAGRVLDPATHEALGAIEAFLLHQATVLEQETAAEVLA